MENTYDLYIIKDQGAMKNNVYVIVDKDTKRTAIIDPANSLKQNEEIVTKLNLILDIILITHTHFDHTQCIDDLVSLYDCTVYVSRIEADYYLYYCKNLNLFEDEDFITVGSTWIKCLLTPGHTMGSACFLLRNSLFTGDTIFMEGCGICNGNGGSASDMFHSIARIKEQVDDSVLVYPGHTYKMQPGMAISTLKQNNIYFLIEDDKTFVKFRMRKNQKNLFNFN